MQRRKQCTDENMNTKLKRIRIPQKLCLNIQYAQNMRKWARNMHEDEVAVELAYRGDELPTGSGYPKAGEQRGTPTEMDWYYFAGLSVEIKLKSIGNVMGNWRSGKNDWYNKRCPKVIL